MVYTQKVSLMLTEFNSRTGRICSIYTIAYFAVVIISWSSFSQRSRDQPQGWLCKPCHLGCRKELP